MSPGSEISSSVLMPPDDLRARVAGTSHLEWFHVSGRITCDAYCAALESAGRTLHDFGSVLDFGCGAGRVLRWLQALMPGASLAGCDVDDAAVAWVREHYPAVDVAVQPTTGLPPSPFGERRFDLVLAYSVFTHLDLRYQDAWLEELRRIVRPDGLLLVSISGPRMLDYTLTKSGHGNIGDLERQLPSFHTDGVLHWRGDGWEREFPDYYHTTFHSHDYVRRHWARWYDVANIYTGAPPEMPQDIVILTPR